MRIAEILESKANQSLLENLVYNLLLKVRLAKKTNNINVYKDEFLADLGLAKEYLMLSILENEDVIHIKNWIIAIGKILL